MSKYILFCGEDYQPPPGMEGYEGSYNSLLEAGLKASSLVQADFEHDWFQIVHVENDELEWIFYGLMAQERRFPDKRYSVGDLIEVDYWIEWFDAHDVDEWGQRWK